jgi:uncharacterized damage-inducible protein DinB
MNTLIQANISLLNQATSLIQNVSDEHFTQFPAPAFQAGVGTHVRHCLDFYIAFFAGLEAKRIDYDARKRDPKIERDRSYACEKIGAVTAQLQSLTNLDNRVELQIKVNDTTHGTLGKSSVSRELQALIEHTIHHYALIAVLLRLQGYTPPPDFGVAPSTWLHWQSHQPISS